MNEFLSYTIGAMIFYQLVVNIPKQILKRAAPKVYSKMKTALLVFVTVFTLLMVVMLVFILNYQM